MRADQNRPIAPARRLALVMALVVAGLPSPAARAGVLSDWMANRNAPTAMNLPSSDGRTNTSLINRWLSGAKTPFLTGQSMGDTNVYIGQKGWEKTKVAPDPLAEAEFAAAKKRYDAGDLARALKLLTPLANREVKKGTPWGEKAQWWKAETEFKMQKYVDAHDSYEILFKQYGGTEYYQQIAEREYQIAQIWLSTDDPKVKPMDWMSRFDGRQPLVDTSGHALKVLDHVRNHDPLGPLADDAALRTADHYHTKGDYATAAVFYDQLLAEDAKSEYRERAQLSSIDSKMKGYVGPEYDVSGLEQARETIDKHRAEFPERIANANGLSHTLDLIRDQEAERAYTTGLYYIRARKPISAEYQFGLVMNKWPKSKWAGEARKEMAKVAKLPRQASLPSKIMTAPGASDPGTMGGMGGNNGSPGGAMGGLMNNMGGMGGMN